MNISNSTKRSHNFKDLTGKRFVDLEVVELDIENSSKRTRWLCKCVCGKTKSILSGSLLDGKSLSCGCKVGENIAKAQTKHGMCKSSEYKIWNIMVQRCRTDRSYASYSMKGIKVCERWSYPHGFVNFYEDMGPRPSAKHSIDRIDNNGNYEPSNCRWATAKQQARNKTSNVVVEIDGKKKCISEWAEELGIEDANFASTVRIRIQHGWEPAKAVLTPIRKCRSQKNPLWKCVIDVLNETGNTSIRSGDNYLLHMVAEKAGIKSEGPETPKKIMNLLRSNPGILVKKTVISGRGKINIFCLP